MCKFKCLRAVFTAPSVFCTVFLLGCSEEGRNPPVLPANDPVDISADSAAESNQDSSHTGPDESTSHTDINTTVLDESTARYPKDLELDDRPGMIISGLNGQAAELAMAAHFVHSITFRVDSLTPGSGDAHVSLLEYSPQLSVAHVADFYEISLGSCRLEGEPSAIASDEETTAPPPLSISGGQAVHIQSAEGLWFSLPYSLNELGDAIYATVNGLPGALPDGANLSIPGDSFPQLPAYPLYEPSPPVRLLPELNTPLSSSSVYSWVADERRGFIKINLLAFDDQQVFQGYKATCYAHDNGSFSLPQKVLDLIAASPYSLQARYSRVYNRLDIIDKVIYFQEAEVVE